MDEQRRKPRILIVEDEPIVGLEISDSLERMGYEACPVVSSGDKVLEAALREDPDLILMDIKLKSFTDGIDAGVRVKMVKDIPVIYMTAYADIGMRERAERTQPAAYLLKPVENDILKREIDAALERLPKLASNPAGEPHA